MITKQVRITAALLALAAMASLPVSAGQVFRKAEPQRIAAPTYLTCTCIGDGPGDVLLVITNNTRSTIPKGTTIYWKIGDANKGTFILANDLPASTKYRSVIHLNSLLAYSVEPRAWYYK